MTFTATVFTKLVTAYMWGSSTMNIIQISQKIQKSRVEIHLCP